MNRIVISTRDHSYNVTGTHWKVDEDDHLHVMDSDTTVYTAARGEWLHVFRGDIGDVFIQPGGFLKPDGAVVPLAERLGSSPA
ncbi:hypothetical protein ACWDTT_36305 [Streptosporangium sandarakinum]